MLGEVDTERGRVSERGRDENVRSYLNDVAEFLTSVSADELY